jgi:hypothetical protein
MIGRTTILLVAGFASANAQARAPPTTAFDGSYTGVSRTLEGTVWQKKGK